MGVTTLDLMRSRAFIGERLGRDPRSVALDVVGGHSGTTIVPLLSTLAALPESEHGQLTLKIQNAGDVVVQAKAGKGSATLSMAAAAAFFVNRLLRGLAGESGVRECAYVATSAVPGVDYFALPCTFGPRGVERVHDEVLRGLSADENERVRAAANDLKGQIAKGVAFARSNASSKL
jgi:malate dehydrogenase